MLNLETVRTLTRHGYEMPAILAAIHAAETNGSADLDGCTIRYNDRGEMITVAWVEDKTVEVRTDSGVFCDSLQAIFTEVTGMYTHL